MDRYYKDGTKMKDDDYAEWSRLKDDPSYSRIGSTQIGPYLVSTVWLGLDHRFTDEGPPLIFETMVFDQSRDEDSWSELYCERYSTEAEALAGHQRACDEYQFTIQEELTPIEILRDQDQAV